MHLEISDLRFGYTSDHLVLNDIDLSYTTPQVMCILGHNGVGKSTLLQCIMGMENPNGGSITIDGQPARSYSLREMAHRFAYIPQARKSTFSHRVIDVVTMGRTSHIGYFANPTDDDVAFAYEQLVYLGIEHLAERAYTDIFGGERQLVIIASALAQEPEALLLDEPTAHLDFGNQFKFLQLVERLHRRGMGVLMTTHFPDHALLLDCTTAILDQGHITACGPAHEVITNQSMASIYGIEINLTDIQDRTICIPGSLNDPLEGTNDAHTKLFADV